MISEGTVRILVVFSIGLGVSAGLAGVVRLLPIEEYAKDLLAFVLPIPIIAIATVVIGVAPEVFPEAMAEWRTPGAMLRTFLSGALSGLVSLAVYAGAARVLRREDDAG